MTQLGNGLFDNHHDGRVVRERDRALRCGALAHHSMLIAQGNLAMTYHSLDGLKRPCLRRDVYSGWLKLKGKEHHETLREANNYAWTLSLYSASKKPNHCCAK